MQISKVKMDESQIKTIYLNWKLEYQDKILPADTLWPFSDNENPNVRYSLPNIPIFNVHNFIKPKYIKLCKIGDTAYCKMLYYLDGCYPIFDKEIKDMFSLNKEIYNSFWKNHTGLISLLNNLRQYMAQQLSVYDLTLINERFYIKEIGERIEFFPVYDNNSIEPKIRIIPAFVLLFTSNISSLFIKYNKIEYNKKSWDNFYFMTNIRIF